MASSEKTVLTKEDVRGIRGRVLGERVTTVRMEADAFKVSPETIRRILRGDTHREVGMERVGRAILPGEIGESLKRTMELVKAPAEDTGENKPTRPDYMKLWLEEGREGVLESLAEEPLQEPSTGRHINPLEEE